MSEEKKFSLEEIEELLEEDSGAGLSRLTFASGAAPTTAPISILFAT